MESKCLQELLPNQKLFIVDDGTTFSVSCHHAFLQFGRSSPVTIEVVLYVDDALESHVIGSSRIKKDFL
jgi:hypothetical protein